MGFFSDLGGTIKAHLNLKTIAAEAFETLTDRIVPQGAAEIAKALFSHGSAYVPYGPGQEAMPIEPVETISPVAASDASPEPACPRRSSIRPIWQCMQHIQTLTRINPSAFRPSAFRRLTNGRESGAAARPAALRQRQGEIAASAIRQTDRLERHRLDHRRADPQFHRHQEGGARRVLDCRPCRRRSDQRQGRHHRQNRG